MTPATASDGGVVDLAPPVGPAADLAVRGTDGAPPAIVDDDHDGLDDAQELAWAKAYLPFISHSAQDGCTTGGLLVRVRPHPSDPTLLHVIYDYLYDADCGLAGHVGDDEVFAATIDPAQPAPDGLIAMIAISHQGTLCERTSSCGHCPGQTACATLPKNGVPWPAMWPSKSKHGSYVDRAQSCTALGTCFDECDDATAPTEPPLANAGEPDHPLIHDLTDQAFITTANGWMNQALFHFDPWKAGQKFGGAGVVASDLVDPAFDTPACH